MAKFGRSAVGMPPPWVYEGTDGVLMLYNGVTRATRIAKLAPGTLIRVEVIGKLPKAFARQPKIGTSYHDRPAARGISGAGGSMGTVAGCAARSADGAPRRL